MKIKSMRSIAVVLVAGAVVACNSAYQSDSASKEGADSASLSPQELAAQKTSAQESGTATSLPALPSLSVASAAYPTTRTVAQVDNYHGVRVNDPYRWLEAQDTPEVKAWVDAQNALAKPLLSALPSHERYTERLTALWDYEKYSTPYMVNSKVFYTYNNGLQNQYVMYVSSDVVGEGKEEGNFDVLIDPNSLSDDGTVSMASTEVSPQAGYLAYTLSDGGSD